MQQPENKKMIYIAIANVRNEDEAGIFFKDYEYVRCYFGKTNLFPNHKCAGKHRPLKELEEFFINKTFTDVTGAQYNTGEWTICDEAFKTVYDDAAKKTKAKIDLVTRMENNMKRIRCFPNHIAASMILNTEYVFNKESTEILFARDPFIPMTAEEEKEYQKANHKYGEERWWMFV